MCIYDFFLKCDVGVSARKLIIHCTFLVWSIIFAKVCCLSSLIELLIVKYKCL